LQRLRPVAGPLEQWLHRLDQVRAESGELVDAIGYEPLALFRVLHKHADLASRMRVTGAGLLGKGKLPAIDREIVILRVSAKCGCGYEWGVHAAALSPQSGLTEAQIESTWHGGPDDPVWTDKHRALLWAADELNDTATLGDAVWDELRAYYDDEQLIEFMVLAGWYRIIANVANVTRLAPEPWAIPRKPLPR
jgi:alkylhydroperoxidase family enzyme